MNRIEEIQLEVKTLTNRLQELESELKSLQVICNHDFMNNSLYQTCTKCGYTESLYY